MHTYRATRFSIYFPLGNCTSHEYCHVVETGINGYRKTYYWNSEMEGSQIAEVDNDHGSRAELARQSLNVTPRVDDERN